MICTHGELLVYVLSTFWRMFWKRFTSKEHDIYEIRVYVYVKKKRRGRRGGLQCIYHIQSDISEISMCGECEMVATAKIGSL